MRAVRRGGSALARMATRVLQKTKGGVRMVRDDGTTSPLELDEPVWAPDEVPSSQRRLRPRLLHPPASALACPPWTAVSVRQPVPPPSAPAAALLRIVLRARVQWRIVERGRAASRNWLAGCSARALRHTPFLPAMPAARGAAASCESMLSHRHLHAYAPPLFCTALALCCPPRM